MKILTPLEYLNYFKTLDTPEYYLVIANVSAHFGSKTGKYCIFKSIPNHLNTSLVSSSTRTEIKIWLDLNGFKIKDKMIILNGSKDTFSIWLEVFKLERI